MHRAHFHGAARFFELVELVAGDEIIHEGQPLPLFLRSGYSARRFILSRQALLYMVVRNTSDRAHALVVSLECTQAYPAPD